MTLRGRGIGSSGVAGQTHGPLEAEPPVQIRAGAFGAVAQWTEQPASNWPVRGSKPRGSVWRAVQWSGRAADFGEIAGSSPALPIRVDGPVWLDSPVGPARSLFESNSTHRARSSVGREPLADNEVARGSTPLAPMRDGSSVVGRSHTRTRPFPVAPLTPNGSAVSERQRGRRRGDEILRIVTPVVALVTSFPASVPYEAAVETERYFLWQPAGSNPAIAPSVFRPPITHQW